MNIQPAGAAPRSTSRGLAAADLLSASRFAAAAIWMGAFVSGYRGAAGLGTVAILAALSDVLDGWVARRRATTHEGGRWLDNLADITFVLTALGCEAQAGALPIYIPILVAISFGQYALDSIVIGARAPIRSRFGHWGGIVNFALVIALAISPPPGLLGTIVQKIAPALAGFYLAAIGERIAGYFR